MTTTDEMIKNLRDIDSYKIIKNDIDTIYSLFQNTKSPILSMEILPFLATVIRGIEDFTEKKILDDETDAHIYDIRNSIKVFTDKYRKVQAVSKESNAQQDNEFKSKLRFRFLEKMN